MKLSPLLFLFWSVTMSLSGVWIGVTKMHGLVASGRVHINSHPALPEKAMGDYMCLKIHQPSKEKSNEHPQIVQHM